MKMWMEKKRDLIIVQEYEMGHATWDNSQTIELF